MRQSSRESTGTIGAANHVQGTREVSVRHLLRGAIATLALGALVLGACGNGDNEDGDTVSPTPSITATPEPTATGQPTSTPTPATSTPTATETPEPTATAEVDFSQTGNLMRDNPGFPPGVWVLSYEAPGSPGVPVELEFDDESECLAGGLPIDCASLEAGMRVTIEGIEQADGVVLVARLEVNEAS